MKTDEPLEAAIRQVNEQMAREQWREAITLAEHALVQAPADPSLLWSSGWARLKLGLATEAISYLRRAADAQPTDAVSYWSLGVAYQEAGDHDASELWLLRALALRDAAIARLELAIGCQEKGLHEVAEAIHEEGLRLAPQQRKRLEAYADFLSDLGREAEAAEYRTKAEKLKEKTSSSSELEDSRAASSSGCLGEKMMQKVDEEVLVVAIQQVRAAMLREQWRDAITLAERALADAPDDASLLWSCGWAHLQLQHAAEAVTYLRRAVDATPTVGIVHWSLGLAHVEAGDADAAERSLLRALALRDSSLGRATLASLYLAQGRHEVAEAIHKEGLRLAPRSRKRLEAYANYLSSHGREAEAAGHRTRAQALDAEPPSSSRGP